MECEESFITMKSIWHSYLVLSLGNCVHETLTKTGLMYGSSIFFLSLASLGNHVGAALISYKPSHRVVIGCFTTYEIATSLLVLKAVRHLFIYFRNYLHYFILFLPNLA